MATTIEEVKKFLTEEGKKFREVPGENYLRTGFITENYTDLEGEKLCHLVVAVEEDGEFLKVLAPKAYQFSKDVSSYNKMALFQTLLQISWETKMLQFEYDPDDGEVRAIIEFPIEDSILTRKQLMRCIFGITGILEKYHDQIMDAMRSGLTPETDQQRKQAFEEFQRFRREERRRELGG
jgi:hypothetical protein